MATTTQIHDAVREKYSAAALRVLHAEPVDPGCCGGDTCCSTSGEGAANYQAGEKDSLPGRAVQASLGCGNPTALIDLQPGQIVLDLGSGGGIDVLLSARRVGPTGLAYGLDMTDEMLALADQNARDAGVENVRFLKGQIEAIPLPDASVDVIISNCVINLAADKPAVLREAARVLRPGGRFAVSDVVVLGGSVSPKVRDMLELWAGCVAGALTDSEYRAYLDDAGFRDIAVEVVGEYGTIPDEGQRVVSAFVRATR